MQTTTLTPPKALTHDECLQLEDYVGEQIADHAYQSDEACATLEFEWHGLQVLADFDSTTQGHIRRGLYNDGYEPDEWVYDGCQVSVNSVQVFADTDLEQEVKAQVNLDEIADYAARLIDTYNS